MNGAAEDGAGSDLHYASGGAQGDANLGGAAAAPADGYRTVHSLP